jgi:cytochrome c oxidase cbb3-type subunit III
MGKQSPTTLRAATLRAAALRANGWLLIAGLLLCIGVPLSAQTPDDDLLEGESPPDWALTPSYPSRNPDPAAVERGRTLFELNGCSFCHGKDIRGGDGGPSLLRSLIVLSDSKGEQISKIVLNGVPNTSMAAFALKNNEIEDIAEFLHSFKVSGDDLARRRPPSIVTGNVAAGVRYFKSHCSSCHDAAGALHDLARRYPSPRKLQQRWLMPHTGVVTDVVVHPAQGAPIRGHLLEIDEFSVSLELADGTQRSFERRGAQPRVEVLDPLAGHKALLGQYRDQDIHDVTAYLVTLK